MEKVKKDELIKMLKFFLFSCSAGIIQLGVTTLLDLIPTMPPSASYLIGLVCSVIWNVTFNRKFTFKAATNVPKAIGLALVFYIPFAPASTFFTAYLTNGDVLSILKDSFCGHQIYRTEEEIGWIAPRKDGKGCYLAIFNNDYTVIYQTKIERFVHFLVAY